ncbi:MAG: hypothetical protein IKY96_05810 [Oscillospiraceae bacterium]|nr:hypothetical protein [Oscillospiraceae bacterium]
MSAATGRLRNLSENAINGFGELIFAIRHLPALVVELKKHENNGKKCRKEI